VGVGLPLVQPSIQRWQNIMQLLGEDKKMKTVQVYGEHEQQCNTADIHCIFKQMLLCRIEYC